MVVSGDQVHIREVEDVFVIGQECPKVEVPAPNSKPATQFQKEFLQVHGFQKCNIGSSRACPIMRLLSNKTHSGSYVLPVGKAWDELLILQYIH